MLNADIITGICGFLSDTDTNNYLSVTKEMLKLKHKIRFRDPHILTKKINKLEYYDSFVNLVVQHIEQEYYLDENNSNNNYLTVKKLRPFEYFLPKNLIKINFKIIIPKLLLQVTAKDITVRVKNLKELKLIKNLPVTNLKIEWLPSAACTGTIPSTVIKLNIYDNNFPPIGIIPVSVRYLKTYSIHGNDYMPPSVTICEIDTFNGIINSPFITHLIFSKRFSEEIRYGIPLCITHVTFKSPFNKSLKYKLSQTVTHLVLPESFNQDIDNTLPSSIKYLTIPKIYREVLGHLVDIKINYI